MKIIIFDPRMKESGHYKYFNWHIAKLLDLKGNQITFVDYNNLLSSWYKGRKLENANISFFNIDTPRKNKNRILSIINYTIWMKKSLKEIKKIEHDYIIFTDPFGEIILGPKIKSKHAFVIHSIESLLKDHSILPKANFRVKNYIKRANKIIVLEKYLQEKVEEKGYRSFNIPAQLYDSAPQHALTEKNNNNNKLTVSTVGTIDEGKNVGFIINLLNRLSNKSDKLDWNYIVAGKPLGSYGDYIKNLSIHNKNSNITFDLGYLSDGKFEQYIDDAQYLAFPYSPKRQNQTSGVLFDAMNNGKPIIAPNIEPFKSYIEEYGIGILYIADSENDFIAAIKKAKANNVNEYIMAINKLNSDRTYSKWKAYFNNQLNN